MVSFDTFRAVDGTPIYQQIVDFIESRLTEWGCEIRK